MRLRFLLRPNWLLLTLVVFAFAAVCFTVLSPWQFRRDAEQSAQNSALQASFTDPPQPLDRLLPSGTAPDGHNEWHRVSLSGTYLAGAEVVARLRTVNGEPAFEVLTPFRADDGTVVLVDRGYLSPDDHSRVPPYAAPPTGRVALVARIRSDETDPKNRDAFADASTGGRLQSYVVDSRVVARASGLPIRSGYLQLDPGQPGGLGLLPLPQLDAGPYFSYALQWIAFGVMAILGWAYFTVRELRPGGALTTERPLREKRKSVAQMVAEDEAEESSAAEEEAEESSAAEEEAEESSTAAEAAR